MNKIMRSESTWTRFILQHRIWLLAVFLLATVFFGYQLPNLGISKDVSVLFPPHHPNMVLTKKFKTMLATPDKLICILEVKNGDIYTQEAISMIQGLTQSVLHLPGCDASDIKSITETSVKHMEATAWGVETNPVIFPDMPKTPEDFARLRKRVETDVGIRGVFVSYDGTAATIMAKWKKGDNLGQLYKDIQDLAQTNTTEQYKVHFAGAPALGAHLIHLTGQFKTAGIWMVGALVVILTIYLGSITGVLLSMTSVILSIVWAFGLASILKIPISFLALAWVLFSCGVSAGFSAFCFSRYRSGYLEIPEKHRAVELALGNLLAPVAIGLTLLGLTSLTLSTSDLPLLSQTGYLGGCWAVTSFFIVGVANPIFLWFLPVPKACTPGNRSVSVLGVSPVLVVLLILALLIGGGVGVSRLNIGDNEPGSAFFFPDAPYNQAFSFFNKKFIGAYNMTIMVEGREKGALNDFKTMELINEFQRYLENETDARACISIAMMIKLLARVYHEGNPKWALIPVDEQDRSALGGAIKMGGTAGQWIDDTWTNGSIQAMYGDDTNQLIKKRLSKAKAFILDHPSDRVDFRLFAGFLGVIAAMDHAGNKAYWGCLWGALILVFFVCLLVFRAVGPALVILLSTIIAQAMTWMFMAFQGICISIHSAPAAPLSIGFGAALGICLVVCARKQFPLFPETIRGRKLAVKSLIRPVVGFGLIPAVMLLPWALLDFKFMADACALIAFSVFAQIFSMIIILPFLADLCKWKRIQNLNSPNS